VAQVAAAHDPVGGIFISGQTSEYLRLWRSGVTISQGLFGTTFFTLTGIHGFHVLFGLSLLAAVLCGKLAIQSAAMFWYFVTTVWIVVFSIVYVWTFL
jgi:heme/copper-type cytochrome/quinol oxidase subunit 3